MYCKFLSFDFVSIDCRIIHCLISIVIYDFEEFILNNNKLAISLKYFLQLHTAKLLKLKEKSNLINKFVIHIVARNQISSIWYKCHKSTNIQTMYSSIYRRRILLNFCKQKMKNLFIFKASLLLILTNTWTNSNLS